MLRQIKLTLEDYHGNVMLLHSDYFGISKRKVFCFNGLDVLGEPKKILKREEYVVEICSFMKGQPLSKKNIQAVVPIECFGFQNVSIADFYKGKKPIYCDGIKIQIEQ